MLHIWSTQGSTNAKSWANEQVQKSIQLTLIKVSSSVMYWKERGRLQSFAFWREQPIPTEGREALRLYAAHHSASFWHFHFDQIKPPWAPSFISVPPSHTRLKSRLQLSFLRNEAASRYRCSAADPSIWVSAAARGRGSYEHEYYLLSVCSWPLNFYFYSGYRLKMYVFDFSVYDFCGACLVNFLPTPGERVFTITVQCFYCTCIAHVVGCEHLNTH